MLGYNFYIKGRVIHGDGRGKSLGFPTLNIHYDKTLVAPKFGVYATICEIDGAPYPGVTNIGHRPTFYTDQITCETHIPGVSGDLYGKTVKISFVSFIREEIKFENPKQLSDQINNDINTVKNL